MEVANALLSKYEGARNKNLKFAFNSNMWVLTLAGAAGAAGAFRSSRDTLAGIGVGAGILLAGDTFLNARPNAKVYQSGMNALTCELVNLKPYIASEQLPTDTDISKDLTEAQKDLENETSQMAQLDKDKAALTQAQADLVAATSAKPATKGKAASAKPAAQAAGGVNISDLTDAMSSLKTAQAQAQKAQQNLNNVTALNAQLPIFAANATASIDQAVAAKITQADVSYTSTVSSIAPLTKTPAAVKSLAPAPTPPSAGGSPANNVRDFIRTQKNAQTAVATATATLASDVKGLNDLQKGMTTLAARIENETTKLNNDVANYGLSTAEANVTTCVKSI